MNTRRAYVDLIYNGTAATAEISGFVTDISYTDPASGEALRQRCVDKILIQRDLRRIEWVLSGVADMICVGVPQHGGIVTEKADLSLHRGADRGCELKEQLLSFQVIAENTGDSFRKDGLNIREGKGGGVIYMIPFQFHD